MGAKIGGGATPKCSAALCMGHGLAASGQCPNIAAHEGVVCQAMTAHFHCASDQCDSTSEVIQLSNVEDAETFELLGQALETFELPAEDTKGAEASTPDTYSMSLGVPMFAAAG